MLTLRPEILKGKDKPKLLSASKGGNGVVAYACLHALALFWIYILCLCHLRSFLPVFSVVPLNTAFLQFCFHLSCKLATCLHCQNLLVYLLPLSLQCFQSAHNIPNKYIFLCHLQDFIFKYILSVLYLWSSLFSFISLMEMLQVIEDWRSASVLACWSHFLSHSPVSSWCLFICSYQLIEEMRLEGTSGGYPAFSERLIATLDQFASGAHPIKLWKFLRLEIVLSNLSGKTLQHPLFLTGIF